MAPVVAAMAKVLTSAPPAAVEARSGSSARKEMLAPAGNARAGPLRS